MGADSGVAVLERFDSSKAKVRQEIRDGFFNTDGSLRMSDDELWNWIGDRAVDELKVVLQLSYITQRSVDVLGPDLLNEISRQIGDEARHFQILYSLVPAATRPAVDERVRDLPAALEGDPHWRQLRSRVDAGDPFAALVDINIVHEGYSAAAIEELANIPIQSVRDAYAEIGADEQRHHATGRDLLTRLWESRASAVPDARRAEQGTAMAWQWPATGDLAERAEQGTAMAWQWPATGDLAERAEQGTSMAWQWPATDTATEDLAERAEQGTSMAWQWPAANPGS